VTNKCIFVDAGSYSAGLLGEEFPCPAGTFSNPGARQCTYCPLGTYSAAGSSSCTPCSVGYYADKTTGSATCTSCPAGYSTVSIKSISSSNCISCNQTCPAGKYISKTCKNPPDGLGTCLDCLAGQTLAGTTNYVSVACGQTFRATLSTATLNPGNYFSIFDNGAYNRAVTLASWVQSACGTPDTSLLQYVVTACTTFANTILGVKPACPNGQYYSVANPPTYSGCSNCLPAEYSLQNTYVSSICSNISSASIGYVNPPPLYFVSSFVKGSAYQKGSQGTYTQCSNVIPGSLQYVTSVCSLFSNTGITSLQNGFYYPNLNQGNPTTLGIPGSSFSCSDVKTPLDYVSNICTVSNNSSVSNVTSTNSNGYYYSGFSQGTVYIKGKPGTLVRCGVPGVGQYTTSPCTDTSNTVFGTFTTGSVICPSTTTYYTKAMAGDAYTVGTDSNCAACSAQFQWKKSCSAPKIMTYYYDAGNKLTVDNLGNVYSLETGSNQLFVNGKLTSPSITGDFIKYYNSNIYSFDNSSRTIKIISTKTWTTTSFSTYSSSYPGEPFINQVTGDIYLTNGRDVTVITQSKTIKTMSGTGSAYYLLYYTGVVVDSQGYIYVASPGGLNKYTNSLIFVKTLYSNNPYISSLTIDSNDNIFISTPLYIYLISPQGNTTNLYRGYVYYIQADTSNVFYIDNYNSIKKLY